jgi:MarR family protein
VVPVEVVIGFLRGGIRELLVNRLKPLYLTFLSRKAILPQMSSGYAPTWSFLTNHARVLLCIAEDPAIRLRDIGEQVGITERAVYRIVDDLVSGGYISRERSGRRNRYTVHRHLPVPDRISRAHPIGELLAVLAPLTPAA